MKKKKSVKWGLIIGLLIIIVLVGTVGVKKMTEQTQHERQVAFLKKHEDDMTKYVKSETHNIKSVQYDWDSVKVETIGNGTLFGAGQALTIDGEFNNISDSNFYLQFDLDESSRMPDIESMTSSNSYRIGEMLYE